MNIRRLLNMTVISLKRDGFARAEYLNNNVVIAAKVWFIPHDAIHYMIKNIFPDNECSMYMDELKLVLMFLSAAIQQFLQEPKSKIT